MNLKKHTTSLDLSIALRDAGYPQGGSVFYWVDDGEGELHDWTVVKEGWTQMKKIDAPLATELFGSIPTSIPLFGTQKAYLCIDVSEDGYNPDYLWYDHCPLRFLVEEKSLPDALAKLWLHLNKEGLLK